MIKRARAEKKQADEEAALRLSEETAAAVSNAEAAVEPAADDQPVEVMPTEAVNDEEEPPELEEVDIEEEKAQMMEQTKAQKQKEWLEQVKKENAGQEQEPFIPWDDSCDLPKPDTEAIQKRSDALQKQMDGENAE